MIPKSGNRFSEKIMLKKNVSHGSQSVNRIDGYWPTRTTEWQSADGIPKLSFEEANDDACIPASHRGCFHYRCCGRRPADHNSEPSAAAGTKGRDPCPGDDELLRAGRSHQQRGLAQGARGRQTFAVS